MATHSKVCGGAMDCIHYYLEDAESLIVVLGLELRLGASILSGFVRTEEKSTFQFGFGLGTIYSACFYSGSGDDLTWIFTPVSWEEH